MLQTPRSVGGLLGAPPQYSSAVRPAPPPGQPPAGGPASFEIPPPWQRGGRAADTTSKGSETDTVAGQKCLGCLRRSRATCSNSRALPSQVLLFLHSVRHFNKLGGRHPQLQWLGGALVRCGEGRGPAPFLGGRLGRNPACKNMWLLDCPRPLITCSHTASKIGFFLPQQVGSEHIA